MSSQPVWLIGIILHAAGTSSPSALGTKNALSPTRSMEKSFSRMRASVHTIVVIDGRHLHSPGHGVFPPTQTHHPSISAVIGGYKAGVTRRCHSQGIQDFWWQSRFHDRILRSNVSVNAVRDYIDRNPQNWLEDPNNPSTAARGDGASPVSTRG